METVKQKIEQIKQLEQGRTYQIYVVKRQTKDTKKYYNCNPIVNGQRHYKVYHQFVYAHDIEKEQAKTVLQTVVSVEAHINMSLSGESWSSTHNVYHICIDDISRGNKGAVRTIATETIAYEPEELKGRRFCL